MPAPNTQNESTPKAPEAGGKENTVARTPSMIVGVVVAVVVALSVFYLLRPEPLLVQGEADATRLDIAARVDGRVKEIPVERGQNVPANAVLVRIDNPETVAKLEQMKAAMAVAEAQLANILVGTLARQSFESQQALDQAENDAASARADVAEAQANHDAAVAGPTREERVIADAQVQAAAASVAVLERRLEKMILRAPTDGVVSVVVAEVGENVRAGQPILMVEAAGKQWLSFNVREDHLDSLTVGKAVDVMRSGTGGAIKGVVTGLRPLGTFATWQAERVIGDHDRNTLRMRLDPLAQPADLEPGMTVWVEH